MVAGATESNKKNYVAGGVSGDPVPGLGQQLSSASGTPSLHQLRPRGTRVGSPVQAGPGL